MKKKKYFSDFEILKFSKNVVSKFTIIRLLTAGERFEILVDPNYALKFRQGEVKDYNKAIAFDEIYSDVRFFDQGER